jgi:glyoxylase-like metal-dependent hydrolase (beta-lactamase superfamily II)
MMQLPAVKQFVANTGVRVYRIPCDVLPNLTGRVYLLVGAGPVTLIDAGSGRHECSRQLMQGIETVRREYGEPLAVRDVQRVVITHGHIDHIGGLAEIVGQTDAQVAVHPLDCRLVCSFEERAAVRRRQFERFFIQAGVPAERRGELLEASGYASGLVRSIGVDVMLDDGMELDGLRFVHTPGHSPGHVCIRVGDILLAGDHVLARTVPQQWPESTASYTGLGHYLDSLEKIRRIDGIRLALGGHEPPMRDIRLRIDEIWQTHARRLVRLSEIIRSARQPLSIDEMTGKMYSHQQGFYYMLALCDVGARVEFLDQRGHLAIANLDEVKQDENAVYRYRLASFNDSQPLSSHPANRPNGFRQDSTG